MNITNNREVMNKSLNKTVTGDNFIDRDIDKYIYASITQPPILIIDKKDSDNELDYIVECPTCSNKVNFGTELFMLSGHHYCIKENCREKLTYLLGK